MNGVLTATETVSRRVNGLCSDTQLKTAGVVSECVTLRDGLGKMPCSITASGIRSIFIGMHIVIHLIVLGTRLIRRFICCFYRQF